MTPLSLVKLLSWCTIFLLGNIGCSVLHSTQVGNIDSQVVLQNKPFEILVSETGVNTEEITKIAVALSKNQGSSGKKMGKLGDLIALFQMGPKTGNSVFDPTYSDDLILKLHKLCPSGHITGLTSIRETNKYPGISGEIVKITGYCSKEDHQK